MMEFSSPSAREGRHYGSRPKSEYHPTMDYIDSSSLRRSADLYRPMSMDNMRYDDKDDADEEEECDIIPFQKQSGSARSSSKLLFLFVWLVTQTLSYGKPKPLKNNSNLRKLILEDIAL